MWQSSITLHLDDYLKILGLLGALTAFGVGLFQYRKAQRWKRAEFVANEMKDFFAAPRVQRALLLIDWGHREIPLLENRALDESQVIVTRQMQTMGLRPHILLDRTGSDPETLVVDESASGEGFTQAQAAIRDCYDAFLDGLERFASYAKADLIDISSLRPYIGYWVADISSPTENADDAAWCAALLTYISFYHFDDVLWLFDAFDSSIRPSSPIYNSFLKLMVDQKLASQLAETVECKYS
jgi:hypothetical protein